MLSNKGKAATNLYGEVRYDVFGLVQHLDDVLVYCKKNPAYIGGWRGDVLFSHGVAPTVSSELEGLTSVFGMGTGVSLPL